jgi:hypothetical protein
MHTRQRDEIENDRDMSRMIETFRELSRLSELSARFSEKPAATDFKDGQDSMAINVVVRSSRHMGVSARISA